MNLVLFITHDTGTHLSPYGYDTVHTPNAQRLADAGVCFRRHFAVSPLCCPSRAACVTGRYPHQNGVMGLTGDGTGAFALYPDERHAAHLFADAGYESVLCGFEHEGRDCTQLGFERFLCGTGSSYNGGGDLLTFGDAVGQWLDQRSTDRPFYLQVGCHETHLPWDHDGATADRKRGVWMPPYLNDDPALRDEMALFQGSIRRLDDGLGRLLDALEQRGLRDDTLFVFTTDHGIDVPRAKGTCYDPGLEVFLILSSPDNRWGQGRVIDTLTSNVDVLPTLLESAGLDLPDNIEGRSLMPLLEGTADTTRRRVFAEKTYHDTYEPTRAVRTERFKYIRRFEVAALQDVRLATITRGTYLPRVFRPEHEELYDLAADPFEQQNLVDQAEHRETLDGLRRGLLGWMRATNDPLLDGPVRSPIHEQRLADFLDLDQANAHIAKPQHPGTPTGRPHDQIV